MASQTTTDAANLDVSISILKWLKYYCELLEIMAILIKSYWSNTEQLVKGSKFYRHNFISCNVDLRASETIRFLENPKGCTEAIY